jgi:hypothetical protein
LFKEFANDRQVCSLEFFASALIVSVDEFSSSWYVEMILLELFEYYASHHQRRQLILVGLVDPTKPEGRATTTAGTKKKSKKTPLPYGDHGGLAALTTLQTSAKVKMPSALGYR